MALFVAAGLGAPALAQTAPATPAPQSPASAEQPPRVEVVAPESLVVNRIVVQGAQRIDQTTVLSYLPIRPGDTVALLLSSS
jgi:outer membrane protein insertion porin family